MPVVALPVRAEGAAAAGAAAPNADSTPVAEEVQERRALPRREPGKGVAAKAAAACEGETSLPHVLPACSGRHGRA